MPPLLANILIKTCRNNNNDLLAHYAFHGHTY